MKYYTWYLELSIKVTERFRQYKVFNDSLIQDTILAVKTGFHFYCDNKFFTGRQIYN